MKLFLSLALRNVFRNRLRTMIALLAIAVGCAALILNGGIIVNIFRELREDAIRGRHGHLQIYANGYSEKHLQTPERYLVSAGQTSRILELVGSNPRVLRATRRRNFSGLISNNERYVPFLGVGVEPQDDAEFSRHTTLRAGEPLSADKPYSVLAGLGLAKKLNAHPGDILNLMTTTESGVLNSMHVRLAGVFEGGMKEFDDWTLKVPLSLVEHLLGDDRTEQIVVLLSRTEEVALVRSELQKEFQRERLDVELRSWDQLAVFHNQVVGLFGRELSIIRLIIGTIVILGISNVIGMALLERRLELATFRALGIRARNIGVLLMTESLLIGVLGAGAGTLLGIGMAKIASAIGISYPSPPGATRPFVGGVDVAPGMVLAAATISVLAALGAAIIPVWKAIRAPIASTLRHG